jgi:hypothetical protein
MPVIVVVHNSYRRNTIRYVKTDDSLEVGKWIAIQDIETGLYTGTFLVIETFEVASWSGSHPCIVIFPCYVAGEIQKSYCMYTRVAHVP